MTQEVSLATRTVVNLSTQTFTISSHSDMNNDGTTVPNIFQSDVLPAAEIVDNVNGKEGELMLSYKNEDGVVGTLDNNGDLSISLDNDDVNNYQITDENLEYVR